MSHPDPASRRRSSTILLPLLLAVAALSLEACRARPAPPPPKPKAPAVTGSARNLTRVTVSDQNDSMPSLSPDGRYLLFQAYDLQKAGEAAFSVMRQPISSQARQVIIDGFASGPAWHTSSQEVLLISTKTGRRRVVRTSANGGGLTFLSSSALGNNVGGMDMAPDGSRVALHVMMGSQWNVCTVNLDGTALTLHGLGTWPKYSPDGQKLAFQKQVGARWQIHVMDLSANDQVTQLTSDDSDNEIPDWSPDGQWISFTSNRVENRYHIFAMRADGSQQSQLTDGPTVNVSPSWGSDGQIYFSSDADDSRNIWRLQPVLLGG